MTIHTYIVLFSQFPVICSGIAALLVDMRSFESLSSLIIWCRETDSAVPSPVSPLILHTQAEHGAYSRAPLKCPAFRDGVHRFILSTAIGSISSLSGHAIAYRWRLPPKVRWHKPVILKFARVRGAAYFQVKPRTNTNKYAPLFSHTHALRDHYCTE